MYNSSFSEAEWNSFLLERPIQKSPKKYWVHKLWYNYGENENVCVVLSNYLSKLYEYFRIDIL